MRQQHLEALRHVEIDGRRDVAQIAHSRLDGAGQRLAFVDIERAAIVEHEAEIVVAAEGVVPRQPIEQDRRLVAQERRVRRAIIAWLAHSMQLRVDHAFRLAGRARR